MFMSDRVFNLYIAAVFVFVAGVCVVERHYLTSLSSVVTGSLVLLINHLMKPRKDKS